MKVSVFGGTGYVGSYLIDELLDKGHIRSCWYGPEAVTRSGTENIARWSMATSPARIRYGQPWPARMPSYITSAFCVSFRPAVSPTRRCTSRAPGASWMRLKKSGYAAYC